MYRKEPAMGFGDSIIKLIINKSFNFINLSLFLNFENFKNYYWKNGADIIFTHCHDEFGNHDNVREFINNVRKIQPNCFLILTIDYRENLKTYKRNLLQNYQFNFLVSNEISYDFRLIMEKIIENKIPGSEMLILSEKKLISFQETMDQQGQQ